MECFLSFFLSHFLSHFLRDTKKLIKTSPRIREERLSSRQFFTYISVRMWTLFQGETSCPCFYAVKQFHRKHAKCHFRARLNKHAANQQRVSSLALGGKMRDPGNEVEGLRVRRTKTFLFNAYVRDIAPSFFFFLFFFFCILLSVTTWSVLKNNSEKSRFATHTCVKCFPVACTIRAVI